MERCPNCRARSDGSESCRRCGMDHSRLLAAERAADACLRRAVAALAVNDTATAEQALHCALSLQHDPLAKALLGLIQAHREPSPFEPPIAEPPIAGPPIADPNASTAEPSVQAHACPPPRGGWKGLLTDLRSRLHRHRQ
ncbi:hypothetical protein CKO40_08370 [Halochromatium glycolicum]|uniref:Uncharacterized protein n=1 Tax=Halochromatium glycolicum TaxID=85075 RepID=A0AAJ0U3I7_9GAMM|nr:hypothetical protein [Halochromatium glycolicum]